MLGSVRLAYTRVVSLEDFWHNIVLVVRLPTFNIVSKALLTKSLKF